jgi:Arc/MetJ family transcription regulator
MRTNIDIDDALMAQAMAAGPYKTKKDAVEAGLELLARRAAYREILKWEGKLKWEGGDDVDWTAAPSPAQVVVVQEPAPGKPERAAQAEKRRAGR